MKLAGYRSRVQLQLRNGEPLWLGVADWSFSAETITHDFSNSEGYPGHGAGDGSDALLPGEGLDAHLYSSCTTGNRGATIELSQSTFNEQNHVFIPGIAMNVGHGLRIRIWPNRESNRHHYFPVAVTMGIRPSGQVTASQPIGYSFKNDGPYFLYQP